MVKTPVPHNDSPFLITGVVEDVNGRPVPDATVYFTAGSSPYPDVAALSAADGSFTLSVPNEGVYTLACMTPDSRVAETPVTARSDQPTRVRLRI
ncbi:carboxypeptidase-like regulatory domain-containing protein [Streptomyces sp. NBC_00287]|uniref:carboxypeptidase-like regulatory domain-containing protein n=1 Tax=Streptomyces sp. NBC_00287 TaxID=2975702 RepID=UPI002E284B77|nr:carboxypeptidase-like regulatory domain-containing protein [Streptomyces sp. NBC_00287]